MKKLLLIILMMLCLLAVPALAEEEPVFEPLPWDLMESPNTPDPANFLPDEAGYHDDSLDIKVDTFRAYDTTIMRVRVKVADPSQVRTRFAAKYPQKAQRHVSDMTKRSNAVMGINGDWCTYHNQGIVFRNGVEYRMQPNKGRDTLIMDEMGDLHVIRKTTKEAWEAYISGGGTVVHTWTFGPGLVADGVPMTEQDVAEMTLDCGKNKKTQRIAFGQVGPLEYMILAAEGKEVKTSAGLTILELANVCYENGMVNAYNLDGGASSTISLNHNKINFQAYNNVRLVGDCIWFATLVPSAE